MNKKITIVYHKNCADGFSGAWTAWKKLKNKAEYIPCDDRNKNLDIKNKDKVYLIDFIFYKPVLKKLIKDNKQVIVIDHHKTAQERAQLANTTIYNKEKSGSVLAWEYFFPEKDLPQALKYIEDVDLWNWNLKHTKEIFAIIDSTEHDFKEWNKLIKKIENKKSRKKIIKKGKVIVNSENEIIDRIVSKKYLINLDGHEVFAVNSPVFKSEIGHILSMKHPPFGIIWHQSKEGIKVSLRANDTIDVSEIAQKHGGGGHPNAAGFLIKNNQSKPWKKIK